MTTKEKLIIAIAVVAGITLLTLDGIAGSAACESARYNQATGECIDGKN